MRLLFASMERHVFHKILCDLMLRPFIHDLFHSTKPKQSFFLLGGRKVGSFSFDGPGFRMNLDVGFLCNGLLSGLVSITACCDVWSWGFQIFFWKFRSGSFLKESSLYIRIPFKFISVYIIEGRSFGIFFLSAFLGQVTKTKMIIYPKQLEELILTYSWWWRNPKTTTWDV